jgi:predicted nuclease with TOPRIM domain
MEESTQRHLGMMSRVCLDLAKGLQEKQQQIVEVHQQLSTKNQEVADLQEKLKILKLDVEKKLLSQQEQFRGKLKETDEQYRYLSLRVAEERLRYFRN